MKQEAGLCKCKLSADAGKKTVSAYGQESSEGTPVKDVRQWDCLTKTTGR